MSSFNLFTKKIKKLIENKSLRWKILSTISIAFVALALALITTIRINIKGMESLGSSYKSNSELDYFTQQITETEKALENYVNYHTFESIDSYYSYKTKVENLLSEMQFSPSKNEVAQKEYLVTQFAKSFFFYSDKTILAKRSNNYENLNIYYKKSLDCYNYLLSQVLELNKIELQQNAKNFASNYKSIALISTLSIIFYITFCFLLFIFLYFSISSITSPLAEISEVAHRVSKRDFDVPLFNRNTTNEIGNICCAFDRMIISIREYIDTIWEKAHTEAELKEKEIEMQALYTDAQLRALQNQINPHFLFNTLNTGAQLAMMEGADKTCYFIEQVAEFFRYIIQRQTQTVTIDEELGLIDNFVYIMRVRFGNRLEFTKNIPAEYFSEQIPIMTLQPLVENCIKHGLKNTTGKVELNIVHQDNYIVISVSDNGNGMPEEIKKAVFDAVKSGSTRLPAELVTQVESSVTNGDSNKNGTGLISVFLRLKMYFHRDDIFDITTNDSGKGTKFIIRIPSNV